MIVFRVLLLLLFLFGISNAPDCCASGEIYDGDNDYNITDCDYGEYFNEDRLECFPCAPGTYSNELEDTTCFLCTPGTFANETGSSFCFNCTDSHFQANSGATQCLPCLSGKYTNSLTGFIQCLNQPTSTPNLGIQQAQFDKTLFYALVSYCLFIVFSTSCC